MEYTKPEVVVLDNAISVVQVSKFQGVATTPTRPASSHRLPPTSRTSRRKPGRCRPLPPRLLLLGNQTWRRNHVQYCELFARKQRSLLRTNTTEKGGETDEIREARSRRSG